MGAVLTGGGAASACCARLGELQQEALRERFREYRDPRRGPFTLTARPWFVRERAP